MRKCVLMFKRHYDNTTVNNKITSLPCKTGVSKLFPHSDRSTPDWSRSAKPTSSRYTSLTQFIDQAISQFTQLEAVGATKNQRGPNRFTPASSFLDAYFCFLHIFYGPLYCWKAMANTAIDTPNTRNKILFIYFFSPDFGLQSKSVWTVGI